MSAVTAAICPALTLSAIVFPKIDSRSSKETKDTKKITYLHVPSRRD